MANYRVTKIIFANAPSGTLIGTLQYKLATASSYATVNSSVSVAADGTVAGTVAITGLTSGLLYNVKFFNNCDASEYLVTTITAP